MSYDDETPAPTCHAAGCAHTEGLLRCGLSHGHAGPHDLSRALSVNEAAHRVDRLAAIVEALTDAVAECVVKVRALERADAKGCVPALDPATCGACALRKGARCAPRNIGVDGADRACVLFCAEGQAP